MRTHKHLRSAVQFHPQLNNPPGARIQMRAAPFLHNSKPFPIKPHRLRWAGAKQLNKKSLSRARALQRQFSIWREEGVLLRERLESPTYHGSHRPAQLGVPGASAAAQAGASARAHGQQLAGQPLLFREARLCFLLVTNKRHHC